MSTLLAQVSQWAGELWLGRIAFVLVFLAMTVWLIAIPAKRIGHEDGAPPMWRNVRSWAIFVALTQAAVYAFWG